MESIRKLGDVVNTALILGGAEAIIADRYRMLLDTLAPGEDWAKSLLSRMGYVKSKATTKEKVAVEVFETIKASFLDDVYATVVMEDIPQELTTLVYIMCQYHRGPWRRKVVHVCQLLALMIKGNL